MPERVLFETYADQYDAWFDVHEAAYASELNAVRALLPRHGVGVESGVGTGRFAAPLGITFGVEPAGAMRERAAERGLRVVEGVAEALPFEDKRFDYALMVTTVCFLDDVAAAFAEAYRILKPGGALVVGLIDRSSVLGQHYEQHKAASVFEAHAYGPISIAACWAEGEDAPWFIVTDEEEADYLTLRTYSRRMWIEELFGDLEGGGFQLQRSRLYEPSRLSRLLMAVCLAYLWLLHVGASVVKQGLRSVVDRRDRRDRSLAEIGRHWIRRCMTNGVQPHVGLIPYF